MEERYVTHRRPEGFATDPGDFVKVYIAKRHLELTRFLWLILTIMLELVHLKIPETIPMESAGTSLTPSIQ